MKTENSLSEIDKTKNTTLATPTASQFQMLDIYSDTGIIEDEQPRVNAIATISAGTKKKVTVKNGPNKGKEMEIPVSSENGEMYVHGDAPGLIAALKQRNDKSLTVMFPSDDPRDFIQMRFAEYSATSLLCYGDQNGIVQINGGKRVFHEPGTQGFAKLKAQCKVHVSVYFTLGEWTINGADMVFPDGLGYYRLRFTSRNSLHNIGFAVQDTLDKCKVITGVPFELFLKQEEHVDPTGAKRDAWIWQARTIPPNGIRLDARMFHSFAMYGREQVSYLQLKAPEVETIETAMADVEIAAVADEEIEGEVVSDCTEADSPVQSTGETPEPPVPEPQAPTQQPKPSQEPLISKGQISTIQALALDFWGKDWKIKLENEFDGWANFNRMTYAKATEYIDTLESQLRDIKEIQKEEAAAAKAAQAEAEKSVNDNEAPPQTPLSQEVRKKREEASAPCELGDDFDKSDPFLQDGELPNAGKPREAVELPPKSEPKKKPAAQAKADDEALDMLMKAALEAGFQHEGEYAFAPMIQAINATNDTFLKGPIMTVDGIPAVAAKVITSLMEQGRIKAEVTK